MNPLFLYLKGVKGLRKLKVGLRENIYGIHIGAGVLERLANEVKQIAGVSGKIVVVSDENVWALYGERICTMLREAGAAYAAAVLPPGEDSKSMAALERLYGDFAQAHLGRDGIVVAFGGGVVGDVAGFAAATYMRGVQYVQVPTSLLAQVDSSVGGKTAVNLRWGKNMAGAFYQPKTVLIDTDTLSTLPAREWRAGMAEVVKYGAIRSKELFERLAAKPAGEELEDVIYTCCKLKAGIVARDERDHGERMLLNFGHTFGHAVEMLGGFQRWKHGEAVAIGMVLAAKLGERMGRTVPGTAAALEERLQAYGLDLDCPYGPGELEPLMELDKKGKGDAVRLILLREIGDAFIEPVRFAALGELLREAVCEWSR